ncbi:MAG: hypothetical protein EBR30_04870 [Cytophagia bacterium]|nr:hypothetical protein [Cytophagia bacterium]
MRQFYYLMIVILLISSCDEEMSQRLVPVELQILSHNSNNELYAGVPVEFGIKAVGTAPPSLSFLGMELYVDGSKIDADYLLYSFADPGEYQVKAFVKMSNEKTYEFDTVLNIVNGPPVMGDRNRGESVLFGWKSGSNYNILLSTYHGSSVSDYEVLAINGSLEQLGQLKEMDFGWYPRFYGHDASLSGKLALIYDNSFRIYDASLALEHHFYFKYDRTPRKIFITDETAVLLFDSLSHVTLKKVDLNTGQMVKGATQYVGVNEMNVYDHFFRDESRIITYYVGPSNVRTLLSGYSIGNFVEFNQYFQPPVFIDDITPISSGGYVINTVISEEEQLNILSADETNIVKWKRSFKMNFRNYWYQTGGYRTVIKELGGFIYVFFDNMRCIKLSIDGQLIWDKYFYPEIARFEDVMITSENEFIMLGTCLPYSNSDIDYSKRTDILCIRINTDGFRVGS